MIRPVTLGNFVQHQRLVVGVGAVQGVGLEQQGVTLLVNPEHTGKAKLSWHPRLRPAHRQLPVHHQRHHLESGSAVLAVTLEQTSCVMMASF